MSLSLPPSSKMFCEWRQCPIEDPPVAALYTAWYVAVMRALGRLYDPPKLTLTVLPGPNGEGTIGIVCEDCEEGPPPVDWIHLLAKVEWAKLQPSEGYDFDPLKPDDELVLRVETSGTEICARMAFPVPLVYGR